MKVYLPALLIGLTCLTCFAADPSDVSTVSGLTRWDSIHANRFCSPPNWAINRPGAKRINSTKSRFRTLQKRPNLKYRPTISSDERYTQVVGFTFWYWNKNSLMHQVRVYANHHSSPMNRKNSLKGYACSLELQA